MTAVTVLPVVAILVSAGVLHAAPDLGNDQQREAGRELYGKYCVQCHGAAGDG